MHEFMVDIHQIGPQDHVSIELMRLMRDGKLIDISQKLDVVFERMMWLVRCESDLAGGMEISLVVCFEG